MNPNRKFAELTKVCKTCDDKVCTLDPSCCTDFTDAREVLKVMMERGEDMMDDYQLLQFIQETKERILALEARVRALESWRDDDETYKMEQKEYE